MITNITPVLCNQKKMANYAYILHNSSSSNAIIIDAAEEQPITQALETLKLTPTHIITTHHHFDHVEGNLALKERYDLSILAPIDEFDKIPGATTAIHPNQDFTINNITFHPIKAKGHTNGHQLYYIPKLEALFTGDVLFNLCIGGLFEGTPQQMFETLQTIKALPDNTKIFPGHEYTQHSITKDMIEKPNFAPYLEKLYSRLQGNLAPSTLQEEKLFNPYLIANTLEQFIG